MRTALLIVLASSVASADAGLPPLTIDRVFDGQGGTAATAPDPGGAASPLHVIGVVAGAVTIRDAGNGAVVSTSTADAFWKAAGVTGTPAAFAQRAVFDATNQRWYISAEEATTGAANRIY